MNPGPKAPTGAAPDLAAVRVDRAMTELAHGRAVRLLEHDAALPADALLVCVVENLCAARLSWLAGLGAPLQLLLSGEQLARQRGFTLRMRHRVPRRGSRSMSCANIE